MIRYTSIKTAVLAFENIYEPHEMKKLGFEYATCSGITWSMGDLVPPKEKPEIIKKSEEEAELVNKQYQNGFLTDSERRSRILVIWEKTKEIISKLVPQSLDANNPVYSIIDSGSRGSWAQPVQMMGMKGLVQNPKGETIELPVISSFKEGFSVLEYFISTHGARKGSTDTALKTASAGYLTRRLIDVSQDLLIREEDCKTKEGLTLYREDGLEFGSTFANRLFSRTALEDIKIGNKVNIQDGAIIHCTYQKNPTEIGNRVSIGHNAMVHGCIIHDDVLIGMGSIVMDRCIVHSNSIIAAGAVLLEGTVVESGTIYAGVPAKKVKDLSPDMVHTEIDRIANNYVQYASWFKDYNHNNFLKQ